jgi:hypothetical protein
MDGPAVKRLLFDSSDLLGELGIEFVLPERDLGRQPEGKGGEAQCSNLPICLFHPHHADWSEFHPRPVSRIIFHSIASRVDCFVRSCKG